MYQPPQQDPKRTPLPHPLGDDFDLEARLRIASDIQSEIQSVHDGFSFRVEQYVMILLAEPDQFKDGGTLSEDMSPTTLKRRLTRGSPFAKHCKTIQTPTDIWALATNQEYRYASL